MSLRRPRDRKLPSEKELMVLSSGISPLKSQGLVARGSGVSCLFSANLPQEEHIFLPRGRNKNILLY